MWVLPVPGALGHMTAFTSSLKKEEVENLSGTLRFCGNNCFDSYGFNWWLPPTKEDRGVLVKIQEKSEVTTFDNVGGINEHWSWF